MTLWKPYAAANGQRYWSAVQVTPRHTDPSMMRAAERAWWYAVTCTN